MSLGLYQTTTTMMKKVGGPIVYHILLMGAGALVYYGINSYLSLKKENKERFKIELQDEED